MLAKQGVVLRNCHHNICYDCLRYTIDSSEKFPVTCLVEYTHEKCGKEITSEEIKGVLTPDMFVLFNQKCGKMLED